ncbi:hypothetical protein GGS23DRAFT_588488 [Durotheca rogersii]|uniref:uncharacterized protein n=1 Tax=Durotheca rogersii TaxID=419775 RepID=UPI00221F5C20|nr:uncharacterized protein GGS23DRAFT_588488 [Durotheca rogersii]KAI5856757.1 hypothetical protein GGS23DRAFT_588488 [Durotheca rogersii]
MHLGCHLPASPRNVLLATAWYAALFSFSLSIHPPPRSKSTSFAEMLENIPHCRRKCQMPLEGGRSIVRPLSQPFACTILGGSSWLVSRSASLRGERLDPKSVEADRNLFSWPARLYICPYTLKNAHRGARPHTPTT